MSLQIPPGYAQASIEHWLDGYPRPAVTTIGLKILGTEVGGLNIADIYWGAYHDAFRELFDTQVSIRDARVVVGQDGGEPMVYSSTSTIKGTGSRESAPPAIALMVSKNTNLGGRANRGRMFLPWALGDTSVAENGAILPAVVTTAQSCANQFLENLSSPAGEFSLIEAPVILHNDPARLPTVITGFSVNPTVRTQRNRQTRY